MVGLREAVVASSADSPCGFCTALVHGICAALSPDERAEIDRLAKRAAIEPKEALFSQGQAASRVYTVTSGVVRLYKLLPDGRRQIIGFRISGDFIGLASGANHALSADAINRVTLCWFSKPAFARFSEDKPPMLRKLNEFAHREIAAAHERMLLLGRFTADEKIASFVLGWRERTRKIGRVKEIVELPMSRRDIADYLGLTIETVSRTFTKLERDKVFAVVAGGVRLTDEKRAAALATALPPN